MKTVVCKISGAPAPNDVLILCYRSPGGGRTHVMHKARGERPEIITAEDGSSKVRYIPADTIEDIARELVAQATGNNGWNKYIGIEAKPGKGATIIIQCPAEVASISFSAEVEGTGTMQVDIEEL